MAQKVNWMRDFPMSTRFTFVALLSFPVITSQLNSTFKHGAAPFQVTVSASNYGAVQAITNNQWNHFIGTSQMEIQAKPLTSGPT